VRAPLNEDCWLGQNGMPTQGLAAACRGGKPIAARVRHFRRAATATIWLRLTPAGRRALARHPHLSARLAASFRAPAGTPEAASAVLSPASR
jgi:hypothetical protein